MGEFCLFYYLRNFRSESTDLTDSATDSRGLQQMTTIVFNLTVYNISFSPTGLSAYVTFLQF